MTITHAMWIHGHSVHKEYPVGALERKGFSVKYIASKGKSNWLHFAIPTPVIVDDSRLQAMSVLVRFRTDAHAAIESIHVYDGEHNLVKADALHINAPNWHVERIQLPEYPLVHWGIGISVLVSFENDASWVEFSAAGCDLSVHK